MQVAEASIPQLWLVVSFLYCATCVSNGDRQLHGHKLGGSEPGEELRKLLDAPFQEVPGQETG